MVIRVEDIRWLRLAARKCGSDAIPSATAAKLIDAQLIRPERLKRCLKITKRGEIALVRLG